ncbi:DMT family transporter [Leucobacter ruminantium]|uniref:DMT family transporter n=1 Tax=Leucobacter ruminantium TaxID=1289170 RepID=UPI003132BC1C
MIPRGLRADAFLLCAIVSEVTATLSLKALMRAPWLVVVVVIGYGASFVFLALTLRNGKGIGVAYGIWGASGVVLTAVASWWLFGEAISPLMAIGFALIACGVVVVEVGSELHRRRAGRDRAAAADAIEGRDPA